MRWFVPAFNGDFRMVEEGGKAVLIVHDPTPAELVTLQSFMQFARGRGWTAEEKPPEGNGSLTLGAKVSEAGAELVRLIMGDRKAAITALSYAGGKLEITEANDPALPAAAAAAEKKDPDAKAASVKRPTPCCPSCVPGAIQPASEVLLAFLTPEQHRDWARHRVVAVEGGLTGHRYLLAHRHSEHARRWGRICYDADDEGVLHFYDWSIPPEEEVLAAMLILIGRENWLRCEATALGANFRQVFKNPFGGAGDGTETSGMLLEFGKQLLDMEGAIGQVHEVGRGLSPLAQHPAYDKVDVNGNRVPRRDGESFVVPIPLGPPMLIPELPDDFVSIAPNPSIPATAVMPVSVGGVTLAGRPATEEDVYSDAAVQRPDGQYVVPITG